MTIRVLYGANRNVFLKELEIPVKIGRESGNSIQLKEDDQISRFHAKPQPSDGQLRLIDLDNTYGTKVNGNKFKERTLHPGETILIGKKLSLSLVQKPRSKSGCHSTKTKRTPTVQIIPRVNANRVLAWCQTIPHHSLLPRLIYLGT
ncbi:MAG: FHA domain-containing protein [Planctomycetota bacterium]|nr:FHA domain-containing protein [Planctomycetota bacterium]